jgi:hypothetical protein
VKVSPHQFDGAAFLFKGIVQAVTDGHVKKSRALMFFRAWIIITAIGV